MTTVGYGDYYCKSHFGRFTTVLATMLGILGISLMLVSLEQTTKLNQYQALSYEFIYKLQSREKIRHHSAVIVSEVLRICLLRKRLKKLDERKALLHNDVMSNQARGAMDAQALEMEVRIRETMNKITREKMHLSRLKKSLAQEFDWPVEELLRQLKSKMDVDITEIMGQVNQMHQARSLLQNIQSY